MNYRESTFSTSDGLSLHEQSWLPDEHPTATVVLIHGLAEHGGRYAHLAERLVGHGYAVYALDLRGHGRSGGRRIYIDYFQQHVEDLACFLRRVQVEQSCGPLFLFGHSMGGLIAVWLTTENVAGICGVAISAAALRLHSGVFPLLRWLAFPAGLLLPGLRVVALNFSRVSRDSQAVAAIQRDPLVYHGHMPNRTAAELLRVGLVLPKRVVGIRQPLLIQHGTADLVTDLRGAQTLYEQAGTDDKTLKLYEGLYHNLLDEPEKEQVVADLIAWLNMRRDRWRPGG